MIRRESEIQERRLGNIEYLLYLTAKDDSSDDGSDGMRDRVKGIVDEAHGSLNHREKEE